MYIVRNDLNIRKLINFAQMQKRYIYIAMGEIICTLLDKARGGVDRDLLASLVALCHCHTQTHNKLRSMVIQLEYFVGYVMLLALFDQIALVQRQSRCCWKICVSLLCVGGFYLILIAIRISGHDLMDLAFARNRALFTVVLLCFFVLSILV